MTCLERLLNGNSCLIFLSLPFSFFRTASESRALVVLACTRPFDEQAA